MASPTNYFVNIMMNYKILIFRAFQFQCIKNVMAEIVVAHTLFKLDELKINLRKQYALYGTHLIFHNSCLSKYIAYFWLTNYYS